VVSSLSMGAMTINVFVAQQKRGQFIGAEGEGSSCDCIRSPDRNYNKLRRGWLLPSKVCEWPIHGD
jgi:hypothetical protein